MASAQEPDLPQPPAPLPNWEEFERGAYRQLPLPGMEQLPVTAGPPVTAERAFLALAREWRTLVVNALVGPPPPRRSEELALASLLLSVEWAAQFSPLVVRECEENAKVAASLASRGWYNRLPWRLCGELVTGGPDLAGALSLNELTVNLNHQDSAIREWMLEIAWIVRDHLPVERATHLLLTNVADKLAGVNMSAGLALALYPSVESFEAVAQAFTLEDFAEQYRHRLDAYREVGWKATQRYLWELESSCRKIAGSAVLGLRRWEVKG